MIESTTEYVPQLPLLKHKVTYSRVPCIYCIALQTKSSIASTVAHLTENQAMIYNISVCQWRKKWEDSVYSPMMHALTAAVSVSLLIPGRRDVQTVKNSSVSQAGYLGSL